MRKKASDEARLTINLGPTIFSQLNEEASVSHTSAATLAASYVEEHLGRKQVAADCEAQIEKLKKELADYKQLHQREINSLTTELTRLKAALDFKTVEVARLKATSAKHLWLPTASRLVTRTILTLSSYCQRRVASVFKVSVAQYSLSIRDARTF